MTDKCSGIRKDVFQRGKFLQLKDIFALYIIEDVF